MQRRQALRALWLLALAGPATTAALAKSDPADEQPTDLMPSFWRWYDASRQASTADRIAALAAGFFLPQAEHYSAAGFNGAGAHGRLLDSRVASWLGRLDQMAGPVRAVSDALPTAWDRHRVRFAAANLQLPSTARECFLPSLFSFTGYSRIWQGRPSLFIAPDGMVAQLGHTSDPAVLLDHEAFHVFHAQAAPDVMGPLLWMRLWREGLAAFVSARLNPSATQSQVLMSGELATLPPSDIAAAARLAGGGLDSDQLVAPLFDLGRGSGLPNRMGYLLGLRAAQVIAGQRPLTEAAHLSAAQVRPALATALAGLARNS